MLPCDPSFTLFMVKNHSDQLGGWWEFFLLLNTVPLAESGREESGVQNKDIRLQQKD